MDSITLIEPHPLEIDFQSRRLFELGRIDGRHVEKEPPCLAG